MHMRVFHMRCERTLCLTDFLSMCVSVGVRKKKEKAKEGEDERDRNKEASFIKSGTGHFRLHLSFIQFPVERRQR